MTNPLTKIREVLEWYAADKDNVSHKFRIVDENGQDLIPLKAFGQRARDCLQLLSDLEKEREWRHIDEWHEDFGDCLFLFFNNDDYCGGAFTSPLCLSFEDDWGMCNQKIFKRVDTSRINLPQPPLRALGKGDVT